MQARTPSSSTVVAALPLSLGACGGSADTPSAAFEGAVDAHRRDDLAAAVAGYTEVLAADPEHLGALVNRGLAHAELLDTEAALADFSTALALDPEDAECLWARGRARLVGGNPALALEDLTAAIELGPLDARFHEARGDAFAELGELEAAVVDLSNAIRLAPDDARLLVARGQLQLDRGRPLDAEFDALLAELADQLQSDPDDADLRLRRAIAWLDSGEPELCLEDLDVALAADPAQATALLTRGHARLLLGDSKAALDDYTAAIAASPTEAAPAHVARGVVYDSIGGGAEARDEFRAALDLAPDDPEALERLAWLLATCPDGAIRDGARALELARALDPATLPAWRLADTLAAAQAEAGDFEAAVATLGSFLGTEGAAAPDDLAARLAGYERGEPFRDR